MKALREAPYAFCSKLDDWQDGGNMMEERWRQRLCDVPLNLIAYLAEAPAGMVSATSANAQREVELISMWVAPFARGRKVGDALVAAVIKLARDAGVGEVALAVMENNEHAARLYRRHGFTDDGRIEARDDVPAQRRMTFALPP